MSLFFHSPVNNPIFHTKFVPGCYTKPCSGCFMTHSLCIQLPSSHGQVLNSGSAPDGVALCCAFATKAHKFALSPCLVDSPFPLASRTASLSWLWIRSCRACLSPLPRVCGAVHCPISWPQLLCDLPWVLGEGGPGRGGSCSHEE